MHRPTLRTSLAFVLVPAIAVLSGCSRDSRESAPARPALESAPPPSGVPNSQPPNAPSAPQAGARPAQETPPATASPLASTDIDRPTPLTAKSIAGSGNKQRVSYFYGLGADPGTITLTGTAKNAPSASSIALVAALLTGNAERLCSINLGNTTADKTESASCAIEKSQPLVLRVDLDTDTIDFNVALDGPIRLADPGASAASTADAAGAGSTDIDAPTRLTAPVIKGAGTRQATSYFYALHAGPGMVRLIADGKNASTGTADALQLRLLNLRSEEVCRVSLGNVTRDDRKVAECRLEKREPTILRVNLDPNTIDWRARIEGAVDFEPYTSPKTITIALNERVLFDSGQSILKPESETTLREAAARVKKFGRPAVMIAGHTDNAGSAAANLALSQARAAAVRDYFVQQEGIAADRLTVKAFGMSQPVADNGTPDGRARNRRVEVIITPE